MWPVGALCRLSGEDTAIILDPRTDDGVAAKFADIGLLVLAIFALSVYSSVHFLVNLLGGSHLVAMAIGLVWGGMIAIIYYLLLFTITPPILMDRERPAHGTKREATTEKGLLAWVSLLFRLLFVIFLAIVIAQPWLVSIFDTSRWATDAFYLLRIQVIHRHYPWSWLVTLVVVMFFIVPIALKYRVRNHSNFYTIKKEREREFVLGRYQEFKQRFSETFMDRFGIDVEWYESCTDPPFNMQRKGDHAEAADQQQLLDRIYGREGESEEQKYIVHDTTR